MALYTIDFKELVDNNTPIFDFDYEFYDDTKKSEFEEKFINHFLYREIGTETVDKFKHYLKCKCDETLPYYNMLFRTALIDYEKTVNYNLSDTYTREVDKIDNITGTDHTTATNSNTATTNMTLTRDGDVVNTIDKMGTVYNEVDENKKSVLDSSADHIEDIGVNKNETLDESQNNSADGKAVLDTRKVESNTPSGLLSLAEIVDDLYADKVNIDKDINSTSSNSDTVGSKKGTSIENTNRVTTDGVSAVNTDTITNTVNGTTHEGGTVSVADDTTEHNSGTIINDLEVDNTLTKNQDLVSNETETSTRIMKGSYGVITEADMLQKHIALQQTLSTIYKKLFEDCDDLFMQIY